MSRPMYGPNPYRLLDEMWDLDIQHPSYCLSWQGKECSCGTAEVIRVVAEELEKAKEANQARWESGGC